MSELDASEGSNVATGKEGKVSISFFIASYDLKCVSSVHGGL